MIYRFHKKNSLYFQLCSLVMISAVISSIIFFVLNTVVEYGIEEYYSTTNYSQKQNEKYISKLQQYITDKNLGINHIAEINSWVSKQKVISIDLYAKNNLIYSSAYPDIDMLNENVVDFEEYAWKEYYKISLADEEAMVCIYGNYTYQLYNYIFIMELILAFLLFFVIFILGIRKKINYMIKLKNEVEILEGGDLNYNISICGKDEISELADGIECMRKSFREQSIHEAELFSENKRIITEMSHDIRTPITSIILYLTILKKENNSGQELNFEYIEKIEKKAEQLKQLSENLFQYSLVEKRAEIHLEKAEKMHTLFYDLFSEACSYLEQKGFEIHMDFQWSNEKIQVDMDCIARIMDNIVSNIVKYGDYNFPITIKTVEEENMIGFIFENKIAKVHENIDSTGIGINSITSMMNNMGGGCNVRKAEDYYSIKCMFPIKK